MVNSIFVNIISLIVDSMKSEYLKQSQLDKYKPEEPEFQIQSDHQMSSVRPSEVTISNKNAPIEVFFRRKEEQLQKKQSSFNKILESKEFQIPSNDNNFSKSISKFSRFSKSSIRKKDQEKELQLKGIIDEHKKMINQLQGKIKCEEELNQFQKNLLKEEKNRYLSKIQDLQSQIEQLYRDNYRLKEIQKAKPVESFNMGSLNQKSGEESMLKPYVINTLNNDLNRINMKNYSKSKEKQKGKEKEKERVDDVLGSKLEKERPITTQEFFNKKPTHFGLYQEKFPSKKEQKKNDNFILQDLLGASFDEDRKKQQNPSLNHSKNKLQNSFRHQASKNMSIQSINRGQHFDTFHMANTLSFVNDSAINESRQMVNMTSTTSTRNKVAFFKNSLVLIREPDIQIAFKRSDLNEALNKMRIIFYINNKINKKRSINFTYQYQHEYFDIKVDEKLTSIESQAQGREVIEISLISNLDLNGVTDLHINVDNKVYDLWLPALFIKFRQTQRYRLLNDQVEMNILPDKQFASFASMSQVAPLMFGGKDQHQQWAYLYGQSRFGNFTTKLTWRQRQLIIQANQKWVDFLGFVLHFFK